MAEKKATAKKATETKAAAAKKTTTVKKAAAPKAAAKEVLAINAENAGFKAGDVSISGPKPSMRYLRSSPATSILASR